MPKVAEKQVVINEIKEKLERASSIVLVNSRGLTVEQDTVLRKKLREAGVDYKVYKNTMIDFAVQGTSFESIKDDLAGPSALAVSYDDATAAARVINAELKGMPALEFKAGVIENTYYDAKGVAAVAAIPPRDELIAKLLGSFKSPLSSFARVINAIAEEKDNGNPAPAEAVAEPVAEEVAAEPIAEVAEAPAEAAEPVAEENDAPTEE